MQDQIGKPGDATHWRKAGRAFPFALLLLFVASSLGCHTFRVAPPAVEKTAKLEKDAPIAPPNKSTLRLGQFVFLSEVELKENSDLFRELKDLGEQVTRELELPEGSKLIQVYLFENRPRYERFMHDRYPDLPRRRAFFVAQPHAVGGPEDLLVYTFWGDRVRQDLRHELTHALLHSVLKDVPLWLDEGLAEYFELPPGAQGVNGQHLEQLRDGTFKPDLAHLEQLSQVQQMNPAEYREAWAWVHLMLRDKPEAKTVLTHYLQQLRTKPNPGELRPRLAIVYPDLETTLTHHLATLNHKGDEHTERTHAEGIE
jgi:hypothetical protein